MGKLAEIKTKENTASVEDFINSIPDETKRQDSFRILELMQKASGETAKMWGASMIGFGNKIYKSPTSGREVAWFKMGFAPRKANLSFHLLNLKQHAAALEKLGKHKTGEGCLYINKLADVNLTVLEEIINATAKNEH
ncbi:DUF1801 domain-containing protein [Adhaeribacter sp. BT258]|uniref:DUF1801 domain-containing protein n=1 Tax=Adhaeribacter terrigena TaxID=2793070 RepID=A0ABS1C400_9BACT|nr:DUF1801 domain-containing protein [Adhaeribacter terrigena]MBK0404085.1 DUF1801 domain-containing protein [Adhaeribacter terrigena]